MKIFQFITEVLLLCGGTLSLSFTQGDHNLEDKIYAGVCGVLSIALALSLSYKRDNSCKTHKH